jgi:hypothetical protein
MNEHLLEDPITEGWVQDDFWDDTSDVWIEEQPEYICPTCGDTAAWCPERN